MIGLIAAIISGIAMTIQGVFNTKASEKIGTWEINTLVQGSAFIITLGISLFLAKGDIKAIKDVNKLYLTGGIFSVIIIATVMLSIKNMGTTYAIATILVAQLVAAAIINAFGLFNSEKIIFSTNEIIGVVVMISGILIFKFVKF